MKLKSRLWVAMGMMALLMLTVVISNYSYNRRISKEIDHISKSTSPLALSALKLQTNIERAFNTIHAAAIAGREDLLSPLKSQEESVETHLKEVRSYCTSSPAILAVIDEINNIYSKAKDIGFKWVRATLNEDWSIEPALSREFTDSREHVLAHIEEISSYATGSFSDSIVRINSTSTRTLFYSLVIAFLGLVLFIGLTIKLYQSITKPLGSLLSVINKKNLSEKEGLVRKVDIQSQDEFGQLGEAFNQMLDRLDDSRDRLYEYTEKLEQKVEERTIELTNEKKALQESERYLKALWNTTPSGLMVIEKKSHRIVDLNPFAEDLIGKKKKDVVGLRCHKIVCPAEINNCPVTDLNQAIDGDERTLITADRGDIPILKSVQSFKKHGNEYLIESFSDISEQKAAKEKIELARSEAEAANHAKSEFLANMSHELRTPLNHIIGFSEILVDGHIGKINPTQEEYLNDVIHSSQHLLSLINDVLDLAKVEAAKLDLEFSVFDPNLVLKNSLSMIKEKALKRNINISAELKNVPSALHADERRIKQILYNLLSNSVKFTKEGGWIRLVGETIDMSYLKYLNGTQQLVGDLIESHGQLLYVAVEDSGIGLREKYLEEIFEPFEQVKLDGQNGIGGTGLGLPLTKDLVELHGGIIWAESEGINKGSKFSFVIPLNAGSLC